MKKWLTYYEEQSIHELDSTTRMLIMFIDSKLAEHNFNVQSFADMLGISRRQLYREIDVLLDMPVARWMRELRLYKAQWLLRQKRANSLEDLASQVGFKSPAYFGRIFNEFFDADVSSQFNRTSSNLSDQLYELA